MVKHVANQSYVVAMTCGRTMEVHRSQLMPHVEDVHHETPFPLYYFSGKGKPLEASLGDFEVEAILDHKRTARGWEFKVKWKGYDSTTWEPTPHFPPNTTQNLWLMSNVKG